MLCCIPCPGVWQSFDGAELLECIRKLVEVDQDWVPHSDSASLYIRPTFLGTEVRDTTSTTVLSHCLPSSTYMTSQVLVTC